MNRPVLTRLPLLTVLLYMLLALPLPAQNISDPAWGFSFPLPAGWKVQKDSGGAVLGHDTIAGLIIVFPHGAASLAQMRAEMEEGIAEEGVQLALAGAPQPLAKNALAAECEGWFQGELVKGRTVGAVSPSGGGAYVIALTTPAMYGRDLAAAAEQIARGMQFPQGSSADLVRALSGTWATMSTHSQTTVTLNPGGQFSIYSESSYGGGFSNQYGDSTGSWGTAGSNESRGRWTVNGVRERGVITLVYDTGDRVTVQYRVHVEGGQTYWNEYYFNDALYGRQR